MFRPCKMKDKMKTKTCTKCGEKKPATPEYFQRRTRNRDGLSYRCKVCKNEEKRNWVKNNPEKLKAGKKRYLAKYPDARKFKHIKKRAKRRSIDFKITLTEYRDMFWGKPCHYCGAEVESIGLDRKYSDEGYILDNLIPCCQACNSLKGVLPYDIFLIVVSELSARGILSETLDLTNATDVKTIENG